MKLTTQWLNRQRACEDGVAWFKNQDETDVVSVAEKLIEEKRLDWANWLVARKLKRLDQIRYAIFAAELALPNFEVAYPNDDRPRKAIEAAKEYLKHPSVTTSIAAYNAARAAYSAASAAYSVADVAYRAAYSAASAASVAYSAAYAASVANVAEYNVLIQILEYGIRLLAE